MSESRSLIAAACPAHPFGPNRAVFKPEFLDLCTCPPPRESLAVSHEIAGEYPHLWKMASDFDFAERLGGCADPVFREADRAMHEIWMARRSHRPATTGLGKDYDLDNAND